MKIEKIDDKIVYLEKTFTKRLLFNEEKVLNFVLNLMPGQVLPPHKHENSDLIMHVIAGGCELTVDDKVQNITKGDVIYTEGQEMFSMVNNTDENLSCFVVLAPRPEPKIYAEEIKEQ